MRATPGKSGACSAVDFFRGAGKPPNIDNELRAKHVNSCSTSAPRPAQRPVLRSLSEGGSLGEVGTDSLEFGQFSRPLSESDHKDARPTFVARASPAALWSLDIWKTETVLRRSKILIVIGIQIAISSAGAATTGPSALDLMPIAIRSLAAIPCNDWYSKPLPIGLHLL